VADLMTISMSSCSTTKSTQQSRLILLGNLQDDLEGCYCLNMSQSQ
jgi:hypothetical protein